MKRAFLTTAVSWLCLLAACTTCPARDPIILTKTVQIPIAVRCRPALGAEPSYPDTDLALRRAPNLYARVQLLVAGRLMRIARDAEKTAALAQCAG